MKTKRFLCILLAVFIALSSLCVSACAETVDFLEYSSLPVLSSGQSITWGSSYAINFDGTVYQGYSAACKGAPYYPICEKIGLFNHILQVGEEAVIGNLTIRYKDNYYCEILKSGSQVCSYSVSDNLPLRWGFSIYNNNSVPYITFYLCNGTIWDNISDYNYVLVSQKCFPSASEVRCSNDPLSVRTFSCSNKLMNEYLYYPLSEICPNWSYGGNEVGGGNQPSVNVFFDSWTTCPKCGSHNVSYKASFLQTGTMVLTGQIGYVFKCRDCGASWRGIVSNPDENELFKQYMQEVDYNDTLVEDNSLPPFVTTGGTVDLPSDVGGVADYIQQAFSALSSFTSAFNDFFSSVFAVLPAPVLGVILLGVGLVVIIGIIKVVRG